MYRVYFYLHSYSSYDIYYCLWHLVKVLNKAFGKDSDKQTLDWCSKRSLETATSAAATSVAVNSASVTATSYTTLLNFKSLKFKALWRMCK